MPYVNWLKLLVERNELQYFWCPIWNHRSIRTYNMKNSLPTKVLVPYLNWLRMRRIENWHPTWQKSIKHAQPRISLLSPQRLDIRSEKGYKVQWSEYVLTLGNIHILLVSMFWGAFLNGCFSVRCLGLPYLEYTRLDYSCRK